MRIALIVAGVLAALVGAVAVAGWTLPVRHRAAREVTVPAPPDSVYALLTDVERYPAWRSDVRRVEVLSREPVRFREHGGDGAILFEVAERAPARRLVVRIADRGLPFGGQWTYDIAPAPTATGRTTLRITEDGEVYNPIFRFVSRFVMGHDATIERYLRDVDRRFTAGRGSSP